nr:hypothetical protein [Tanacetum cinerariifolium]
MQEAILFYKGLDVPTKQILDSKGVIPTMKVADAKKAIEDMADYSQKWHNGTSTSSRSTDTSDGLPVIQAQVNNLGREIKKLNGRVYAAQQTMEESLIKFITEYAKRHDENSKLIKEIQASMDVAIRNQGALIKALEIQIRQMRKVLQERGSRNLLGSTETNPRDHVKLISTAVEADTTSMCRISPSRYAVLSPLNRM